MSGIAELLADPSASDAAVARAAGAADAADAEVAAQLQTLVQDEERLQRHPAIVGALFHNARAPMALVNQAVAVCARAGVRVDQIPSFDEVADALNAELVAGSDVEVDAASGATGAAPSAFDLALAASQEPGADGAPDVDADVAADVYVDVGPEDGSASEVAAAAANNAAAEAPEPAGDAPKKKRKSAVIDFGKLKLFEKIRLATLGNAFCRQTLLRDSNRLVAMAAIRSPGITDMEVIRAAGNRAVSEDVIRYIANAKDYVKLYPVKLSLIGNPKCPLALTLKMLPHLRPEDLKNIARSKNVPNALSTAARKLSATRSAPGSS